MVGRVAEAESALAEAASQPGTAEGVSALASSLAEAIEADRATVAEVRQTVVARAEAIAGVFARVFRAIRLTILLAERLDRGWAWRMIGLPWRGDMLRAGLQMRSDARRMASGPNN